MRRTSSDPRVRAHETQVEGVLGRWLTERRDLMTRLCALAGALRRDHNHSAKKPQAELDLFCEVLVDYVSAGHFEVYRTLLEEHERIGTEAEALALYDMIIPSTEAALDFNDRYFRGGSRLGLQRDLSALGRMLAARFECEDALIRSLGAAVRPRG